MATIYMVTHIDGFRWKKLMNEWMNSPETDAGSEQNCDGLEFKTIPDFTTQGSVLLHSGKQYRHIWESKIAIDKWWTWIVMKRSDVTYIMKTKSTGGM